MQTFIPHAAYEGPHARRLRPGTARFRFIAKFPLHHFTETMPLFAAPRDGVLVPPTDLRFERLPQSTKAVTAVTFVTAGAGVATDPTILARPSAHNDTAHILTTTCFIHSPLRHARSSTMPELSMSHLSYPLSLVPSNAPESIIRYAEWQASARECLETYTTAEHRLDKTLCKLLPPILAFRCLPDCLCASVRAWATTCVVYTPHSFCQSPLVVCFSPTAPPAFTARST